MLLFRTLLAGDFTDVEVNSVQLEGNYFQRSCNSLVSFIDLRFETYQLKLKNIRHGVCSFLPCLRGLGVSASSPTHTCTDSGAAQHPTDASLSAGKAGLSGHTKRGCGRKTVKALSDGVSYSKAKPRKSSNQSKPEKMK